jgi:glycosyltransferase domain-containing protein
MPQQKSPATGILIPTKNRPDFLIRQLTYYADVNCRCTIYIGDSSDSDCFEQNKAAVRQLEPKLNIVHLSLPELWVTEAWHELLKHVTEPYAAYCGDDDFLVPATLEKCGRFLDENPDYSIAHGTAFLIATENGSAFGKINTGRYNQFGVEDTSACQRLRSYLRNYFPVTFSLQRTQEFRRDIEESLAMADKGFKGQLALECLRIIRGKAKQLDDLYLVRHGHSTNLQLPDPYDWITGLDWTSSYQTFFGLLVNELALQDHLTVSQAQAIVKETFWLYLNRVMGKHWAKRYGCGNSGVRARTRKNLGRIAMLKRTWQAVRSILPGKTNKTNLLALRRSSSPYHADFMPIYRAVTVLPPTWVKTESN